ncbi:SGNH/GDSL hydrolase family protein [Streptomyces sp. NBC_00102]|uniref:SGNH/GDSL hydrolase family protein n=1 Tax=Streptomyces sp. NBC_00102 TaxID=2975652 RepID=UPI00225766F8|nr:SGNH/GDSL hydrolase family protein [Streptomyces sp. NBC_00102]MCX5397730.1 SGNH/GDSL hydrolase family protein [Streptomyces sp. NBC_00102]
MPRFRTRPILLASAATLVAGALVPTQLVGAQPAAAASYDWVALGDSYTAGVIPAAGDVFEYPRDGCDRTDRSYPQVIDRDLGSLIELTNVSCGAATIQDITFRAQEPIGRHLPPVSEDPDYPFPPVPPQSDAVKEGTDVITVGAGGNTLGFADILMKCLELGQGSGGVGTPCKDELAASIPAKLNQVSRDYDQMLAKLHEKGPHAKILAVGYPTIVPEDTSKCHYNNVQQFLSITQGDLDWLREDVLEPLNKVIEKSADTLDTATFVNLYDSSKNHSVCDSGKWVEGLFDHDNRVAFVHPNAKGHQNAADRVTSAILNAISPE